MVDCCICQPAAYWRSAAGAAVGPFDEQLQYAMDYDYWIRFDRSGFVIQHMREKMARSRLYPEAKTLRARRAIYREILDVCRRRGGYISRSYVDGVWHHLVYERPGNPARLLRRFPKVRPVLVSLHYRWLNRHLYTRRQWIAESARAVRGRLVRRLRRMPRLFALLLRIRARLRARRRPLTSEVAAAPNGRLRVSGFWPDNWVEQRLEVVVDARAESRKFRLVGRPVAGMVVEVSATGTRLGEFQLAQTGRETVTVQLPPGPHETVTFVFSDHIVDAAGRPISFLLEETNLFREEDLSAPV